MAEIFAWHAAAGIAVEDLSVRRPTLDEVFMALTGHPADTTGEDDKGEVAA
jgi:ABC-2 type transport system ATP-binding protein